MKYTDMEVAKLICEATEATREKFDGYGFAAGFLGSMLERAIVNLPNSIRREFIQDLENTIVRMKQ
jgi:hypothetical protein